MMVTNLNCNKNMINSLYYSRFRHSQERWLDLSRYNNNSLSKFLHSQPCTGIISKADMEYAKRGTAASKPTSTKPKLSSQCFILLQPDRKLGSDEFLAL